MTAPNDRALDRLASQETNAKAKLLATRKHLAKLKIQRRMHEDKALAKRMFLVGKAAYAAGLLAWDNSTLHQLFVVLARLHDTANPVIVLDRLLSDQQESSHD